MNYIVFGGTKGIGKAVVDGLLDEGHAVWSVSRSDVGQLGVESILWDALSEEPIIGLPAVIDGVVYTPGSINLKPFNRLKPEDFQSDFVLNVLGIVKALQACLPGMKEATNASVVLFSTVAVSQGMLFHTSIAAAKGAVEGLTRSLAAEWAPQIRVNAIAPSLVNTPLASRLLSTPEKIEASALRHPLRRIGEPNDIAQAVVYLLSNRSAWTTGQILAVDGGMSAIQ